MTVAGIALQLIASLTGLATIAVLLLLAAAWLDDHEVDR